jgi:hypothetical protein
LIDGILLLKLANTLAPGVVDSAQFNQRKIALHYVTNHKLFHKAMLELGLKQSQLYNPNDIMTGRHPEEFLNCIGKIARAVYYGIINLYQIHFNDFIEAIARLVASNDKYSHLRYGLPSRLLIRTKSTPAKRWPSVERFLCVSII